MKKLIIIFLLSFIASYSFAQSDTLYPQPPQNLGGLNVAVRDTGGLLVRQTMVAPVYNDTTAANAANPYTKSYTGSIIYTRDVKAYWFRQDNPRKWVIMGSSNGNNNIDTIFTKIPIFVDTVSSPGRRILTLLHLNGLESGGVVTLDSCMTIDVTPAIYYLNYRQYTTALVIGLALEPADAFDRTDAVVVDSNLNVRIKKGLAGNIAPYINPSSEVLLANIPVPANATCLSITQEIIFDGVGDNAGQWTNSTSGTITAAFTNTTYPFHLLQDLYVQTYTDSSQIIFTKPSGTDTVKSTSILKIPISVNGAFTNQIQAQWFNGSTAVSNNIVLNPYFNPNDSNFYQLLVAPFNIWNFSSIVYNKLVLSFAGQDIAGGKGLYMDYIQIQTGIMNNNPFLVLTTNGTSGAATYDNLSHILNIPVYSGSGGGGDGLANFYLKDSSLSSDRTVDLNGKILQFQQSGGNVLFISPLSGQEAATLQASDGVGNGSFSAFSNPSDGYAFNFDANNGTNDVMILGDAGANAITHTADTHTFNGSIIYNTPISGATTDSVLTIDPSTHAINWRDAASFGNDSAYVNVTTPNDTSLVFRRINGGLDTVVISGGGTPLSGTGYVKMAGTTPSYVTLIPIADGGTNNGALSVVAGTVYYGDGTKLVGLAPGTSKQHLTGGVAPSWKDTSAATGGTVTSVGLSLPSFITVSGSPVTTTGTLTGTLANQGAFTMLSNYTSGSAAPTFVGINLKDSLRRNAGSLTVQARRPDGTWTDQYLDSAGSSFNWLLAGNPSITGSNFLGPLNNSSLRMISNSIQYAILDSFGRFGVGTNTPRSRVTVSSSLVTTQIDSLGLMLAGTQLATSGATLKIPPALIWKYSDSVAGTGVRDVRFRMWPGLANLSEMYIERSIDGGSTYAQWFKLSLATVGTQITTSPGTSVFGYNTTIQNSLTVTAGITNSSAGIINNGSLTSASTFNSILSNSGQQVSTAIGSSTIRVFSALGTINNTNGTGLNTITGYYYNPTVTATYATANQAFVSTTGNSLLGTTSGSTGIGANATIDSSAQLDVTSTTRGVLFPRVTTTQRNAIIGGVGATITLAAGSGYTNGAYPTRAFTGGSGTGMTGYVLVAGGVVTNAVIVEPGSGYVNTDVVTANIGTGSGWSLTLGSVKAPATGLHVYNTTTNQDNVYNSVSWMQNAYWNYKAISATYSILTTDYTLEATSGTFTATLPTAVGIAGRVYIVTNSGAGVVTLGTTSSQTFANVTLTPTTLTINQFGTVTVQSNGTNWLRTTSL